MKSEVKLDGSNDANIRKPYHRPLLQVYGSVKEMTQSGPSGVDEAGSNSGNKKAALSDSRTKENIVRVGQHHLGFGLFLFDYKKEFRGLGEGRQFGVMAEEVEAVYPQAVSIDANGYRTVNYEMLGVYR